MKFMTLADWTGVVETDLFAPSYTDRSRGDINSRSIRRRSNRVDHLL